MSSEGSRLFIKVICIFILIVEFIGTAMALIEIKDNENHKINIKTKYYLVNSTPTGTFNFYGLDGTNLFNGPIFEAGYGENTEKVIFSSSFEVDSDKDYMPDGWTYDLDFLGNVLTYFNINIWKISNNNAASGKYSLELNDPIGFLKKEAYSNLIPISSRSRYRVEGSVYAEHYKFMFKQGSYSIRIVWLDENGSLIDFEGFRIHVTPKKWINFSFYIWNIPDKAKYMRILLRQSRSGKGQAYFDDIRVKEIEETSTSVRLSGLANPVIITNKNNTMISYNYSLNTLDVLVNCTFYKEKSYVDFVFKIHYKNDTLVRFERITFDIYSDNGTILLRNYRMTPLEKQTYVTDQTTPKIVEFKYPPTKNKLSLTGSDDLQSMELKVENNSYSVLMLYLDNERNHPHFYFEKNKIFTLDETKRVVGESVEYHIRFSINGDEKYIAKMRQPYGYLATLVFTEHADGENVKKSRAIAYGYSESSHPLFGTKGFLGNNLTWTKSIFVFDYTNHPSDALMEKQEYKNLIDQLHSDGVEIVPHSITSVTDNRSVVMSGLDILTQYKTRNWIDHGAGSGKENFEALASQGWNAQSEYYILDLLHRYNYRYAWGYIDYPIMESLNLLEPNKTSVINPYMYYNNRIDDNSTDDFKIFLWNSMNTNKKPEKYYTKANIDKLINEKGVHIGHEYFDYEDCKGHAYDKIFLRDEYKINDIFEKELEYIAQKRNKGDLWVTTVSEFGDYLTSILNVRTIYEGDGKYIIKNDNDRAINGLSFITNKKNITNILIDGVPTSNVRVVDNDIIFWMNISSKSEREIRLIE